MSNLSSIVVPFTNNEVFINLVEKRIIVNNKLLAMSQGYYLSKWWNGVNTPLSIETLAYIALRKPPMSVTQYGQIMAKSDTGELTLNELYLIHSPIESLTHKGYFIIPGYEALIIDNHGFIKDNLSGNDINVYRRLTGRKKKVPYWTCSARNWKGTRTIGRYRLMALTFLIPPSNPARLDVNHIDGISDNDQLSNLEWNTRQQNAYHCYSTGLRDDNKAVLVLDIVSKEVFKYFSIGECARHFDTSSTVIFNRCNSDFRIYEEQFLFMYEEDNKSWPPITDKLIQEQSTPKVIVYDVLDETLTIFNDASEARLVCRGNMVSNSISKRANGHGNEKPLLGYHFYRTYNIPENLPTYTPRQLCYIRHCIEKGEEVLIGYLVTNLHTGKETICNSSKQVLEVTGFWMFNKENSNKWRNGKPVKGFTIETFFDK